MGLLASGRETIGVRVRGIDESGGDVLYGNSATTLVHDIAVQNGRHGFSTGRRSETRVHYRGTSAAIRLSSRQFRVVQ